MSEKQPGSRFLGECPPEELVEPTRLELEDEDFDSDFLDVFLPDEEYAPLPEPGDFWIE